MFGERYFEARKRLSTVVDGVRDLGEGLGMEMSEFSGESDIIQGLTNPFLFVTCGEVNAGKSTFINGLLGDEMCTANVLPETSQVQWYRYGEKVDDVSVTSTLQERYRNIDMLKDFNLVDTPGTNSVVKGHQSITERFVPVADLVLFIFPVSNPWGAATWDMLARFPDELKGKVALVLSQKDLRDERDVETIVVHMRQLAEKRLGFLPPVIAVSAVEALKAKREDGSLDPEQWEKSGYGELEIFISESVTGSATRKDSLLKVNETANAALARVEETMEESTQRADQDISFLKQLEGEMTQGRDNYASNFASKFAGMADVFAEQVENSSNLLAARMGPGASFMSLFRSGGTASMVEKELLDQVQNAAQERAVSDAEELKEECRGHWASVQPRVSERMGMDLPDFDYGVKGNFSDAKTRFVESMGRSARQSAIKQKLRPFLDRELAKRRSSLRNKICLALFFLAIGGVLGALSLQPWGFVALGLGFCCGVLC